MKWLYSWSLPIDVHFLYIFPRYSNGNWQGTSLTVVQPEIVMIVLQFRKFFLFVFLQLYYEPCWLLTELHSSIWHNANFSLAQLVSRHWKFLHHKRRRVSVIIVSLFYCFVLHIFQVHCVYANLYVFIHVNRKKNVYDRINKRCRWPRAIS